MVETVKVSTGKSALMMVLVILVIGAAIAALCMIPDIWDDIVMVLTVILIAIAIIVAILFIFMAVLALPMYVAKGEQYQTGISYGIDDVESVKEKSSEEDKAE